MRYDLTDFEWSVIEPVLPKGRPGPRRKNDRRVMNGIFWVLRAGAPWRDLPSRYGPYTTAYNRFNRWRKAGVWDRLMDAITKAHDGDVQMIDSSIVRVHQHAANGKRGKNKTAPRPRLPRLLLAEQHLGQPSDVSCRMVVVHDPQPGKTLC